MVIVINREANSGGMRSDILRPRSKETKDRGSMLMRGLVVREAAKGDVHA